MRSLVERWQTSGEPAKRFAERHGISPYKFQYWRAEFGQVKSRKKAEVRAAAFAPVRVLADGREGGAGAALEIRLAGGDVIRCGHEVAIERLSAVVRVLRERC
jgi:hypothetical protein